MDATRTTLTSNGVLQDHLSTYEVSSASISTLENKRHDIIISLLSCGWHYGLENYIDLIKASLAKDGVLIIDIRHGTGQLEYALDHFKLQCVVVNEAESKHTGGTIGDRYVFKLK